ncbi:hypothetical protein OHS18_32940 [Amycolatopsis sp. NBC_00355]
MVENAGPYRIQPGTVVVLTEGPKPVGYFHVEEPGNEKTAPTESRRFS